MAQSAEYSLGVLLILIKKPERTPNLAVADGWHFIERRNRVTVGLHLPAIRSTL
jgi:hypothetical protein